MLRPGSVAGCGVAVCVLFLAQAAWAAPQQPDPRYRTRSSDCASRAPAGKPLSVKRTDTGVRVFGLRAERVLTLIGDAAGLKGGRLDLCAEYGRVEVMDSDDDQVRLQVRMEALGEGAAKALEETRLEAHFASSAGKLGVSAWHSTLGFTPAFQPAWVDIRLQAPNSGAYNLNALANHGGVGLRRITVGDARLDALVGRKMKGVKGFVGGHDFDHVSVAGNVQVTTRVADVVGSLRPRCNCSLTARTENGEIRLEFTPDPDTGVDVTAHSVTGPVRVEVPGTEIAMPGPPQVGPERHGSTRDYARKAIRFTARLTTDSGPITAVSFMDFTPAQWQEYRASHPGATVPR